MASVPDEPAPQRHSVKCDEKTHTLTHERERERERERESAREREKYTPPSTWNKRASVAPLLADQTFPMHSTTKNHELPKL